MTIGAGILLIAIGAALRYAVTVQQDGVDLHMIGLIVMLAGAAGVVIGCALEVTRRRRVLVRPVGEQIVTRPVDEAVVDRRTF